MDQSVIGFYNRLKVCFIREIDSASFTFTLIENE